MSLANAANGRGDDPAPEIAADPANPSLILLNGLPVSGSWEIQPKESSELAYSEQLRIYDQATPHVRIAVPPRSAASREAAAARASTFGGAFQPLIDDVARRYEIDPRLIRSIAHVESSHNPRAVSPKGAQGLMQVMPATARRFGVEQNLADPAINLSVAAAYLKTLQGLYGNNLPLILAAYNAGEGAVQKYGRTIPPYGETRTYVRKVLNLYGESLAGR